MDERQARNIVAKQLLADLVETSLPRLRTEHRGVPDRDWQAIAAEMLARAPHPVDFEQAYDFLTWVDTDA